MVQFYGKDKNSKNSEVSVYTLKSDSWRGIGDFPYDFTYNWVSGVFASGALYWAVSQNHGEELKNLIAAFDLRTEEYRTSLPWLIMPMWLEMRLLILLAFELKDPICRAGHEYGHGFVERGFKRCLRRKVLHSSGQLQRALGQSCLCRGLKSMPLKKRSYTITRPVYRAVSRVASRRGLKSMPLKKGFTFIRPAATNLRLIMPL
ncbi:hypothetical protein LguiB_032212 [Lonicera macranthoides]